jgi:hypothetical protein
LSTQPFDVIASPRNSHYSGGVVACPITNATHPLLIELSKIALEEYNDENNQVLNYLTIIPIFIHQLRYCSNFLVHPGSTI